MCFSRAKLCMPRFFQAKLNCELNESMKNKNKVVSIDI